MKNKEPWIILIVLFIIIGFIYSPIKNASQKGTNNGSGAVTEPSTISNSNQTSGYFPNENLNLHSPYYGKIKMSSIVGLNDPNPDNELITLYNYLGNNETAKITGWYLKSEITGYYVSIRGASLLPFPPTNTESNVILQQGDIVYLIKGFSPVGISFRTNKCTGYFGQDRSFTPNLPLQCPRPVDEKLPQFSSDYDLNDVCVKVLEELPQCTIVSNQFIRDLPDTVLPSCKTYLTTQINYNTCVSLHYSDTDFRGNEYYIYLNKFGPLWRPLHDVIDLYDQNGLIVDSTSYTYY